MIKGGYRRNWNLPANSVVREKAAQITAMRIAGHTNAEIAQVLDIKPRTLREYLYLAAKNGWLRFDDPEERLNVVLAPKIVDNIEYHLNKKDKTMTIEAARGIGLFKSHQSIKAEGDAPQTVLALKIEMPETPSKEPRTVPVGAIVGKPRNE